MIGAIAGDIIGSIYEPNDIKTQNFPLFQDQSRFTDDTVLTVAVANAILTQSDYKSNLVLFGRKYPNAGYGFNFYHWLHAKESKPYNSWGNGSAMRVSPIGFAFEDENEVVKEAKKSALVSHNHPEGIKGAQSTALAVYLARTGHTKDEIKQIIENKFNYYLDFSLAKLQEEYTFDVSCQGSVPQSIYCFLISDTFEDAIRKAISIGGDSDTIACICGGIAQAYYKTISSTIIDEVKRRLDPFLWKVVANFSEKYSIDF